MTISELGSIGEFLGAIAVLVTLVYLALQIRQNTKATAALIHQARSDQAQEFHLFGANSPGFAAILNTVNFDPENLNLLTEEELTRFRLYAISANTRFENMYFQHVNGFLTTELYERNADVHLMWIPIWKSLGIYPKDGTFLEELQRMESERGV